MKIKLQEKHIQLLESLPEQGMGFQIVDLELKNGIVLRKQIVFNSSLLEVDEKDCIQSENILNISISKSNLFEEK